MYRAALERAARGSVTIVSIGFATVLRELVRSKEDRALVETKVARLIMMGGRRFTYAYWNPIEWNFGELDTGSGLVAAWLTFECLIDTVSACLYHRWLRHRLLDLRSAWRDHARNTRTVAGNGTDHLYLLRGRGAGPDGHCAGGGSSRILTMPASVCRLLSRHGGRVVHMARWKWWKVLLGPHGGVVRRARERVALRFVTSRP